MGKAGHKGFSLIELMTVVAIVGVLAAIGIPSYNDYVQRGKTNGVAKIGGREYKLENATAFRDRSWGIRSTGEGGPRRGLLNWVPISVGDDLILYYSLESQDGKLIYLSGGRLSVTTGEEDVITAVAVTVEVACTAGVVVVPDAVDVPSLPRDPQFSGRHVRLLGVASAEVQLGQVERTEQVPDRCRGGGPSGGPSAEVATEVHESLDLDGGAK